jgi:hypothetical protein
MGLKMGKIKLKRLKKINKAESPNITIKNDQKK